MTAPPSKPLEQMTEEEARGWKDWLTAEGRKPRRFAWARELRTSEGHTDPNAWGAITPNDARDLGAATRIFNKLICEDIELESEYDYEPALNKVVERSADGKRYIVGVRNGELQRLQELTDEERPDLAPDLRRSSSR